jgi:PAS domain S-box-containing protein
MKRTLKNTHFWAIIVIMFCGAFLYYADRIPVISDYITLSSVWLTRYSTYRILSLIPVVYAAFIFRIRGGMITAVFISVALFPRALFVSSERIAAISEIIAFLLIGLLTSWLIERQQQAVDRKKVAIDELAVSLDTIQTQQLHLQLSEERYRGIFENSSEAILICSNTGRIVTVNKACQILTNRKNSELAELFIYDLFTDDNRKIIRQMITDEIDTATVKETDELLMVRQDGVEVYLQLKLSPVLRDGQVVGIQAIVRDITEERHLRQSMQYYVTRITEVQEAERKRISRELHDSTAQRLVGLSRRLDALIPKAKKLTPEIAAEIENLYSMIDEILEEVRRFSQDLRPSILDDLGLIPAIEWLMDDAGTNNRIVTELKLHGKPYRLSPETEITVFRIVQETLNNIKKHARATQVKTDIDFSSDAITIIISDNGHGFSIPERPSNLLMSGKLGLVGMRERARLIGATLIVQSQPGQGTTVTLRIVNK